MKKGTFVFSTSFFNKPINKPDSHMPIELKKEFIGRGEVKGFKFSLIWVTRWGYLYKVSHNGTEHYEVFKKRINKRFATYSYPSSKSFGLWAFTFNSIDQAFDKLRSFERNEAE